MRARRIDPEDVTVERARLQPDLSAHGQGHRRTVFGNVDDQRAALPAKRTRADAQTCFIRLQIAAAALGHGPAWMAAPIEGEIDGAMIRRIGAPGPGIIGREDAADEGDQREAILAVAAEAVCVPPGIAARRRGRVEQPGLGRRR